MPQGTKQPRHPGAPKGNQNALKHGRRSAAAIEKRRSRNAMLKASALVLNQLGMLDGRCRCKPLRPDQIQYVPAEWLPLISPWYFLVPDRYWKQQQHATGLPTL
jgi:hypothetical protein